MVNFGGKVFLCALWLLMTILESTRGQDFQLAPSPCPDYFVFKIEDGILVGYLKVVYLKQSLNKVEIEFSLISPSVTLQGNGRLSLVDNDEIVTTSVIENRPVFYKLEFPKWEKQPTIQNILVNDRIVCKGGPKMVLPGHSTRSITHKSAFKIEGPLISVGHYHKPEQGQVISVHFTTGPSNVVTEKPYTPEPRPTRRPQPPPQPQQIPDPMQQESKFPTRGGFEETDSTTKRSPYKLPTDDLNEECGKSVQINNLIFNGKRFRKGKYPWLAVMYVRKRSAFDFQCVGSLISKQHILTAAHCTDREDVTHFRPDEMIFALGLNDLRQFSTEPDSINVLAKGIHRHRDYVYGRADADIAVITLEEEVELTLMIRPVCLWHDQFSSSLVLIQDRMGSVAGWGLNENLEITGFPTEVNSTVVSDETCIRSNSAFQHMISERTLCAGFRNESGPCNGDSGSGFVMNLESRWYIRGIVSISLKNPQTGSCDLANYVVYTDVSKFKGWLRQITGIQYK